MALKKKGGVLFGFIVIWRALSWTHELHTSSSRAKRVLNAHVNYFLLLAFFLDAGRNRHEARVVKYVRLVPPLLKPEVGREDGRGVES
jgi:hypothetical protein